MNIKILKAAVAGLVLSVSGLANAGLISTNDYDLTSISGSWLTGSTGWNLSGSINLGLADAILSDGYVDDFGRTVVNGIYSMDSGVLTFGTNGTDYLLDSFSFITSRNYENNSSFILDYRLDGGSWLTADTASSNSLVAPLSSCLSSTNNLCAGKLATLSFGGVLADEWRISKSGSQISFHEVIVQGVDVQSVPEPTTLAIFALGIMGLVSRRFKKQ